VEAQLHSIGDMTSFMATTVEQQAEQLSHIFDLTGTSAHPSLSCRCRFLPFVEIY